MAEEAPTNNPKVRGSLSRLSAEQDGSVAPMPEPQPKRHRGSIYTAPQPAIPTEFAQAVQALEGLLEMQVWLLIQAGESNYDVLTEPVRRAFLNNKDSLPRNEKIALVIDSPGGLAKPTYQLATFLRRHCGGFVAVVPEYAKSAATLLCLGADAILLNNDAELGPLDAQREDPDREEPSSALDEVQALERIHASALEAIDQTMSFLLLRTDKKIETLLPYVLSFVADTTRPLLEKIDTVHYTQTSRLLKVAEEYATRLLMPKYSDRQAEEIARHLVGSYPDHGFVIDAEEAARIGLQTFKPTPEQAKVLDELAKQINTGLTVIGRIEEVGEDVD